MSIAIAADTPTLARQTAGAALPISAGLVQEAGAADDTRAAGQLFDSALQACLGDPAGVEEADTVATASSDDDGQPASVQGVPPFLMALMPSAVPVVLQAASVTPPPSTATSADVPSEPSAVTADSVSTSTRIAVTTVPAGEARPMSLPAAVVADGGASLVSAVALAVETGRLHPRSSSVVTGAGQAPVSPGIAASQVSQLAGDMPEAGHLTALPSSALGALATAPDVSAGDAGHGSALDGRDLPPLMVTQPIGASDAGAARSPDAPLRLPNGDTNQWRQPLMQALGERLQFASERGIDSAVIRLEPPRMGSIEIAIRHQDGALQVNLSATHNEVLRQLQDISDSLRHNLGQRHAGDVTVQVAEASASRTGQGDGERQRQRQSQSEQNPGRALGDAEADGGTSSFRLARNEE